MLNTIEIQTSQREELVDITDKIKQLVKNSGIDEGLCVVYLPHTTAGLTINSCLDSNTPLDLRDELRRLVPTKVDFHHIYDTPADAAGHVKTSLIGCNISLIVTQRQLLLGNSQSILLWEFDGPRKRQVIIRTISDNG